MSLHDNLLEPDDTRLPVDPAAAELDAGRDPAEVAAGSPSSSIAWAVLAERALDAGETVAGYAYARTGYHRALDQLRRNGWKGFGPVPWAHEPNRGFLRSCGALLRAAEIIGETSEVERLRTLIADSDPQAPAALGV